jgi:hypothetical protein
VYVKNRVFPQPMHIVQLDEGRYIREGMDGNGPMRGYVSMLVVHEDNLTLDYKGA